MLREPKAALTQAFGVLRRTPAAGDTLRVHFEDGTSDVRHVVAKRVRKLKSAILCAHGPVLPEIVREVGLAAGGTRQASLTRAGDLPVAGFSVLHLSLDQPGSGIIAIETHVPQMQS